MIDLSNYSPAEPKHIGWLRAQGVPVVAIANAAPIRVANGFIADDGRFEDGHGQCHLVFAEAEDAVFWQPRENRVGTALGRSFALGEDAVTNPGTYAFDNNLNLWASPIDWLISGCDGCFVLDWSRAWSRLQDVPRVAVAERLLPLYRARMKPPRGPETFVLREKQAVAA